MMVLLVLVVVLVGLVVVAVICCSARTREGFSQDGSFCVHFYNQLIEDCCNGDAVWFRRAIGMKQTRLGMRYSR